MRMDEIRHFLSEFTTGSSVLIAEKITISFNALSGISRRPIAHTCSCVLELIAFYLPIIIRLSARVHSSLG